MITGELEPVFAIFNRFQVRNRERIKYALALLEAEPDFTVDEIFEFDREKAPWAKTRAELNEIWRKRVKNDAVSLMLADKTWPETQRRAAASATSACSSAPSRSPATTSSRSS